MRRSKWGIIPLLCLLCSTASAQDEEEGILSSMGFTRHLTLSAGGAFHEVMDKSISSTRYQGIGWAASIGTIKKNEKHWSEVYLQYSHAPKLTRDLLAPTDPRISSSRAAFDYRQMMRLRLRNERLDFRYGGMLSSNYNWRHADHVANSGYAREFSINLGLAARISKEIELADRRLAHLSWTAGVPLVGYYARPDYLNNVNTIDPEDKPGADFMANGTTKFIGKYLRATSRLTYDYTLRNGNALALGYTWDYYNINSDAPVWFAEHTLALTFMFNY